MLSKLFKAPLAKSASRLTSQNAAYFASKPGDKKPASSPFVKAEKTTQAQPARTESVKTTPGHTTTEVRQPSGQGSAGQPPQTGRYHPSLGDASVKRPKLQDVAYLNYKRWPNVAHNDPASKEYIPSERDEYHGKVRVDAWNYIVDGIKRDLKLQEEVYKALEHMDRGYKKGIPGVHRNITGGLKNYGPQGNLGFRTPQEEDDDKFLYENFNNEERFTNQTVYYPKFTPLSNVVEFEKELDNRPVTRNFHPEKGYKYDVETPYEQRFPHVADRYGYPEILGTPFERLMRLEGEFYHPVYLDQPFVNVPPTEPHASLNFEEGEIIYENTRLLEWSRLWNLTGFSLFAFSALFVPYSMIYKTHIPLQSAYDNLFTPYYDHTPFYFDLHALHVLVTTLVSTYAVYLFQVYQHAFWRDYVLKMQYSKDKELVFVTRISPFGSIEEEVFEAHHLEVTPPSVKVATANLASQDADGLWDVTCMASHRNLVLYNEEKYWNPALRKDFFDKVMNYWTPNLVEGSRAEEAIRRAATPKINIGAPEDHARIEAKH